MMREPLPQPDYPMPDGQPNFASPMYSQSGTIMAMTSPEEELINLRLILRNQVKDENGKIIQNKGDALLNEKGVSAVIGHVQSLMHRVTIMSNLKDREIMMLMDYNADTLSRDLMMNRVHYNIKSPSSRDKIYYSALAMIFVTLKRADSEGDRRFWKGSQQEITTRLESNATRNPSLFSKIGNAMWGK